MPVAPDNPNENTARRVGVATTHYVVPAQACENYRRHKECMKTLPRAQRMKKADNECDIKYPWSKGGNGVWNADVSAQCKPGAARAANAPSADVPAPARAPVPEAKPTEDGLKKSLGNALKGLGK